MKICTSTAVMVTLLGFANAVTAQDPNPLSPRELRYVSTVAGDLDPDASFKAKRVEFTHQPVMMIAPIGGPDPAPVGPKVNGLQVQVDGGATVERLRFETPAQAQEYADWLLNGEVKGTRPLTGELRGNQLVLVSGPAVDDPAQVERALETAWKVLPAPGATDAAFTQLADGSVAVSTTLTDGPLRGSIDRAMTAARERDAKDLPNDGITTTETTADVAFASGFRAKVQVDEQGASVYTSTTAEGVEKMKQHFAAVGGHPSRANPVEGTAKKIEDLFRGR